MNYHRRITARLIFLKIKRFRIESIDSIFHSKYSLSYSVCLSHCFGHYLLFSLQCHAVVLSVITSEDISSNSVFCAYFSD